MNTCPPPRLRILTGVIGPKGGHTVNSITGINLQCVVSVARQPAPVNGHLFRRMKEALIRSVSRSCWGMSFWLPAAGRRHLLPKGARTYRSVAEPCVGFSCHYTVAFSISMAQQIRCADNRGQETERGDHRRVSGCWRYALLPVRREFVSMTSETRHQALQGCSALKTSMWLTGVARRALVCGPGGRERHAGGARHGRRGRPRARNLEQSPATGPYDGGMDARCAVSFIRSTVQELPSKVITLIPHGSCLSDQ